MLYATFLNTNKEEIDIMGHILDDGLAEKLNLRYRLITEIQADVHELERCCEILGREMPLRPVYYFVGNNAQEIAANWY